jgi:hypothetical protein
MGLLRLPSGRSACRGRPSDPEEYEGKLYKNKNAHGPLLFFAVSFTGKPKNSV